MKKFLWYAVPMLLGAAVGFLIPDSSGCSVVAPPQINIGGQTPPKTDPKADPASTAKPRTVEQAEKELADAKDKLAVAEQAVKKATKDLSDAQLARDRKKLRWICGICVLVLLGCIAGAIFLPGALKWFVCGAAASIVCGLTCLLIAAILPWMHWILTGFAVAAIGALIYLWRRDHLGLRTVVQAVNAVKNDIPDYKNKLKTYINGSTDEYVNSVREQLGLKPKEA